MKTFQQMEDDEKSFLEFMNRPFGDRSASSGTFSGIPLFNNGRLQNESMSQAFDSLASNLNCQALPTNNASINPYQLNKDDSLNDVSKINERFQYRLDASIGGMAKWQQEGYSVFSSTSQSDTSMSSTTGSQAKKSQVGQDSLLHPALNARHRLNQWIKTNPHQSMLGLSSSSKPGESTSNFTFSNSMKNETSHPVFKVPQMPLKFQSMKIDSSHKIVRNVHDWYIYVDDDGRFHLGGKCANDKGKIKSWKSRSLDLYTVIEDPTDGLGHKSLITNDGQCILHLGCFKPNPDGNGTPARPQQPEYIIDSFQNGFPENWRSILKMWGRFIENGEPKDFLWAQGIDVPVDKEYSLQKYITDPFSDKESSAGSADAPPQGYHCPSPCANQHIRDKHTSRKLNLNKSNDGSEHLLISPTTVTTHSPLKDVEEPQNSQRGDMFKSPKLQVISTENDSSKKRVTNTMTIQMPPPSKPLAKVTSLPPVVESYHLSTTEKDARFQSDGLKKNQLSRASVSSPEHSFVQVSPKSLIGKPPVKTILRLAHWWPSLVRQGDSCKMFLQGTLVDPDGNILQQNHTTKWITKLLDFKIVVTEDESYCLLDGIDNNRAREHGIPAVVAQKFSSHFPSRWRVAMETWSTLVESRTSSKECEVINSLHLPGYTGLRKRAASPTKEDNLQKRSSKLSKGRKQLNQREQLQLEKVLVKHRQKREHKPDMFADEELKRILEDSDSDESFHCPDLEDLPNIKTPTRIGTPLAKYFEGMQISKTPETPVILPPPLTTE